MDKLGVSEQPQHVSYIYLAAAMPFGLTSSYWNIEIEQHLSITVQMGGCIGPDSIGSDSESSQWLVDIAKSMPPNWCKHALLVVSASYRASPGSATYTSGEQKVQMKIIGH